MFQSIKCSRRAKAAVIAAGVLTLAAATPAFGGGNVTVTVNATVADVCVFSSNTATVNITNGGGSNIDPSKPGPATGNGSFAYRCTSGVTPSFTGAVTTLDLAKGADTMTATISYAPATIAPGTGLGAGEAKTRTITASIAEAEYQNKPGGLYTKDFVITMTP